MTYTTNPLVWSLCLGTRSWLTFTGTFFHYCLLLLRMRMFYWPSSLLLPEGDKVISCLRGEAVPIDICTAVCTIRICNVINMNIFRQADVYCRYLPNSCSAKALVTNLSSINIAPHHAILPGEINSDWSLVSNFFFLFFFFVLNFPNTNDQDALSLHFSLQVKGNN